MNGAGKKPLKETKAAFFGCSFKRSNLTTCNSYMGNGSTDVRDAFRFTEKRIKITVLAAIWPQLFTTSIRFHEIKQLDRNRMKLSELMIKFRRTKKNEKNCEWIKFRIDMEFISYVKLKIIWTHDVRAPSATVWLGLECNHSFFLFSCCSVLIIWNFFFIVIGKLSDDFKTCLI